MELLEPSTTVSRTAGGLRRHRTVDDIDHDELEGIRVTSLERTALDLVRTDGIASGVVTMDAALRGVRHEDGTESRVDRDRLRARVSHLVGRRGIVDARFAVEFADGRSESAGESLSRLQMHRMGIAPPELQPCLEDRWGPIYPDFWWEEHGIVGEFDGLTKYGTGAEAVARERRREQRLFALDQRVVRWGWEVALDAIELSSRLRAAGIR